MVCTRQNTGTEIQTLICLLMTSVCVSAGAVHQLEKDGSSQFLKKIFCMKKGKGKGYIVIKGIIKSLKSERKNIPHHKIIM